MDLRARQKANNSACSPRDVSASLKGKNKHTSGSAVVLTRTVKKKQTLKKTLKNAEKSSLAGDRFLRSYFEFPQPAGAAGGCAL